MDAYAKSKTPKGEGDKRATPPDVFAAFQNILGLQFNFDICAEDHTAKVNSYYSEENDALGWDWCDDIRKEIGEMPIIWMNPPYSNPSVWCAYAAAEAKEGAIIVGLLPDDRSTNWYKHYIDGEADTVFIPDKRIAFHDANGNPQPGNPKGSVFALWVPWQVNHTNETRICLDV